MTAVTVNLSKPVTAHGEEVDELTLREPLTKDVIELGMPTLIVVGRCKKITPQLITICH